MRASKPVVKGEVIGLGVLPGQAFSLDVGGDPLLEFVFPLGCIAFGANKAYIWGNEFELLLASGLVGDASAPSSTSLA